MEGHNTRRNSTSEYTTALFMQSYFQPLKTNIIRNLLKTFKSHSSHGRNRCKEASFLWKTVSYGPTISHKAIIHTKTVTNTFFLSNLTPTQQGFIPDILSILHRYYLKHYFDEIIIDLAIQWLNPFQSFLEKSKTNCQQLFLFTALWPWYSKLQLRFPVSNHPLK